MPWQFYLAVIFSLAAVVLAVLRLRIEADPTGSGEQSYVYRPLAMLAIALVAMVAPEPVSVFYKGAIVLALLLALLGETVMMVKGTPLMVGVIFVSFCALLYFFAFGSTVDLQWPTPWVLLIVLYVGAVYYLLGSRLGEFWFPGIIFMLLLALATWMALEAFVQVRQPWALVGLVGVVALDGAATLLGVNEFRDGFRDSRLTMLGLYYLAQLLIAISVWGTLLSTGFS